VQFFIQALRMAPDHEKARLACRVSAALLGYGTFNLNSWMQSVKTPVFLSYRMLKP